MHYCSRSPTLPLQLFSTPPPRRHFHWRKKGERNFQIWSDALKIAAEEVSPLLLLLFLLLLLLRTGGRERGAPLPVAADEIVDLFRPEFLFAKKKKWKLLEDYLLRSFQIKTNE